MTLLSRRDALQFGGAALVATSLLGTRSQSLLARQDEPVTLTFWHYYGGAHTASLEAVLQKYMDEHPNVTIEARLVNFPDFNRTLLQSAAAGDLPDIALINAFDTQMLAEAGIITDLTERAQAWGGTDNYFPGIYETSLWDGKNYGLPHLADAYVLWYNQDIFEEAGLEPPKTWDELRETAKALSGDGRYGIAMSAVEGLEGATAYVLRLLAAGGDITDIDSDAGREAMEEIVGLVESGSMSPGILGWLEDDVATQFATGQAAMMINSASYVNYFRTEYPELNSGLAHMPVDEAGTTFLNAEHLTITSGSENPDAAWDLIVWMQQPEVLNDYLPKRNKLPALKNVAEEPQWADDPVWSVFTSQLEDAWAPTGNVATNSAEILTYIQEAVQASVSGDSTIDEALAAAQVKIDEALAD